MALSDSFTARSPDRVDSVAIQLPVDVSIISSSAILAKRKSEVFLLGSPLFYAK